MSNNRLQPFAVWLQPISGSSTEVSLVVNRCGAHSKFAAIGTGREITNDNATVEELGLQNGSKIRMVVKGGTAVFVAPRRVSSLYPDVLGTATFTRRTVRHRRRRSRMSTWQLRTRPRHASQSAHMTARTDCRRSRRFPPRRCTHCLLDVPASALQLTTLSPCKPYDEAIRPCRGLRLSVGHCAEATVRAASL
jgi:hypothetical protein